MNSAHPPAFLQNLLRALLPSRDEEVITGDLLEAYSEKRSRTGSLSADIWYASQVLSFAPRAVATAYGASPGLVAICCFTAACGVWLGTMDLLLHHKDLVYHESIAAVIVGQALLTLLALPLRHFASVRWAARLGSLSVFWLGGHALVSVLRGANFEGYILIIASLLLVQASLTWRNMFRRQPANVAR